MAKIFELSDEQLQMQMAKAVHRFKQASSDEEKISIKKLHVALKNESARRQSQALATAEK
jgi:hypothetical protein